MTVGTILLDMHNCYVGNEGLPTRPYFDKKLLTAFCNGNTVSEEGFNMLPPSMQPLVKVTGGRPGLPITIPEIDRLADVLIVIRSYSRLTNGKVFRLDNFTLIGKSGQIEFWSKNDR